MYIKFKNAADCINNSFDWSRLFDTPQFPVAIATWIILLYYYYTESGSHSDSWLFDCERGIMHGVVTVGLHQPPSTLIHG